MADKARMAIFGTGWWGTAAREDRLEQAPALAPAPALVVAAMNDRAKVARLLLDPTPEAGRNQITTVLIPRIR